MVKEQRGRISELSRGRQDIVGDYKVCTIFLRNSNIKCNLGKLQIQRVCAVLGLVSHLYYSLLLQERVQSLEKQLSEANKQLSRLEALEQVSNAGSSCAKVR